MDEAETDQPGCEWRMREEWEGAIGRRDETGGDVLGRRLVSEHMGGVHDSGSRRRPPTIEAVSSTHKHPPTSIDRL